MKMNWKNSMFASLAAVVLLAFIVNENLPPGSMAQNDGRYRNAVQRSAAGQDQGRLGRTDFRLHLRGPDRIQVQRDDHSRRVRDPVARQLYQMVVRQRARPVRRRLHGSDLRRGLRQVRTRRARRLDGQCLRLCLLQAVACQSGGALQYSQRNESARKRALEE